MTSALFNAASVSALLSTVVSLIGGGSAWLLGRVPDWDDVRPLSAVGLSAALVAACSFPATLEVSPALLVWSARVQVLALALHVAAWHAYALRWGTPRQRRRRLAIRAPLVAAGLLALVPGAVYGDAVSQRPLAWLGVVYRVPSPAPLGLAVTALLAGYAVAGVLRIATLRGLPDRRTLAALTAVIAAMGLHDALVESGLASPAPSLLDFALYLPALAIAVVTMRRIVVTAGDLRRLRTGLEVLVVERTAALERSQAALFAAERRVAPPRPPPEARAAPAAERRDASAADLPRAPVAAPRRARVLVADADPRASAGLVRELAREHEVEAVGSVAAALAALADRSFDVLLCDAALPGGGGERLWEELLLRAPGMLGRVAFLVGAGEPASARAFLDRQPQPVLQKPFGLGEVQVLLDWLGLGAGTSPAHAPLPRPFARLHRT